jgi:hypothetical protein
VEGVDVSYDGGGHTGEDCGGEGKGRALSFFAIPNNRGRGNLFEGVNSRVLTPSFTPSASGFLASKSLRRTAAASVCKGLKAVNVGGRSEHTTQQKMWQTKSKREKKE